VIDGADTRIVHVSDDYFETMGMTVAAGRPLGTWEGTTPAAVLSEVAAARLFDGASAVGHRISRGEQFDGSKSRIVVGVVKNARFARPQEEFGSLIFLPMDQGVTPVTSISVRTRESPAAITAVMRRIVGETVPGITIGTITTYEAIIEERLHRERLLSLLAGTFAAQILFLAGIGLYGLTAFTVVCRRREIGVRIALGARSGHVVTMILRRTLLVLAAGGAIGLGGTLAVGRATNSLLFGMTSTDRLSLTVALSVLACVGLGSALLPAYLATRIRPVDTLRVE